MKADGQKRVFDLSAESDGETLYHNGRSYEILKFTATNDDITGKFETKPLYYFPKKNNRPMVYVGKCIKIQKLATVRIRKSILLKVMCWN